MLVSRKITTFADDNYCLTLKFEIMKDIEPTKGEIVMYQPDETIRLEVRVEDETVWLSQAQMADLFGTDRSSIAKHILNIYETNELEKEPTCAKIAQVRQEGNRKVRRSLIYYNLDMILSVGYRVNSKRGTRFRQWANQVLKDYLLKGYAVNQQYPPITINTCQHNHDRFLIIDDVVYLFGASLKDAGKKLFAYIRMQETPASEIIGMIR